MTTIKRINRKERPDLKGWGVFTDGRLESTHDTHTEATAEAAAILQGALSDGRAFDRLTAEIEALRLNGIL